MAMPESDERRLDETIFSALIHHPRITPAQRKRAWERLCAAAAQQSMLPPDEPSFPAAPCPETGKAARGGVLHPVWDVLRLGMRAALIMGISLTLTLFAALTTDDERYRRAERTRLNYDMGSDGIYVYNVQLRFAYSLFRN